MVHLRFVGCGTGGAVDYSVGFSRGFPAGRSWGIICQAGLAIGGSVSPPDCL
ncbi:hypothetical protein Y601_5284 [Burkholderia pseudomallei MSHR640]|nr:hypothetical protein Y601_5284 [Burkholderia pseudomallei MSHR640]